jgi:hypothetical protein
MTNVLLGLPDLSSPFFFQERLRSLFLHMSVLQSVVADLKLQKRSIP